MTRILTASLLAVACLLPAVRAEEAVCGKLAQAYEDSNKAIGAIIARGLGDDSAVRQTNRELETVNERLQQIITLQQMAAYKCRFPIDASSGGAYLMQAVKCRTARLQGQDNPPDCARSKW